MKNLTLRLDEEKLHRARCIAADRSTSLNALIRNYLDDLICTETRVESARRELLELCSNSKAEIGGAKFTRDSLYDR